MMFGTAPTGESGSVGFDFKNNVEMKVKSESDTTGFKKISLIDDLGINFSYNMMADSMKWSIINSNIRLKFSKSYTLSLNATWDPYIYELDKNGRPVAVDKLRILNGKGFGKLQSTGTSFSYSVNQETFKKLFGGKEEKGGDKEAEEANLNLPDDGTIGRNPNETAARRSVFDTGSQSMGEFDDDGYLKNPIQWNLSFNYSVRYGYDMQNLILSGWISGKADTQSGISGSLQPRKTGTSPSIPTIISISRSSPASTAADPQLHCWSMSANLS